MKSYHILIRVIWTRGCHYRRIMYFQLFYAIIELTLRTRKQHSSVRCFTLQRSYVSKRHHVTLSKVRHVNDNIDAQIWIDHHSEQWTSRLRCWAGGRDKKQKLRITSRYRAQWSSICASPFTTPISSWQSSRYNILFFVVYFVYDYFWSHLRQ